MGRFQREIEAVADWAADRLPPPSGAGGTRAAAVTKERATVEARRHFVEILSRRVAEAPADRDEVEAEVTYSSGSRELQYVVRVGSGYAQVHPGYGGSWETICGSPPAIPPAPAPSFEPPTWSPTMSDPIPKLIETEQEILGVAAKLEKLLPESPESPEDLVLRYLVSLSRLATGLAANSVNQYRKIVALETRIDELEAQGRPGPSQIDAGTFDQ